MRAITGLSTALGMTSIAEGVETQDQFVRAHAAGCTEVQGYFFSKPVPAVEVPRLLRQFRPEIAKIPGFSGETVRRGKPTPPSDVHDTLRLIKETV